MEKYFVKRDNDIIFIKRNNNNYSFNILHGVNLEYRLKYTRFTKIKKKKLEKLIGNEIKFLLSDKDCKKVDEEFSIKDDNGNLYLSDKYLYDIYLDSNCKEVKKYENFWYLDSPDFELDLNINDLDLDFNFC